MEHAINTSEGRSPEWKLEERAKPGRTACGSNGKTLFCHKTRYTALWYHWLEM